MHYSFSSPEPRRQKLKFRGASELLSGVRLARISRQEFVSLSLKPFKDFHCDVGIKVSYFMFGPSNSLRESLQNWKKKKKEKRKGSPIPHEKE